MKTTLLCRGDRTVMLTHTIRSMLAIAFCCQLLVLAANKASAQNPQESDRRGGNTLLGVFLGIAGGVGSALVIAKATDYALEEGGAFGVFTLGALAGGLVGAKIGSSSSKAADEIPGRLQLGLRYGYGKSPATNDIGAAIRAGQMTGHNTHHSIVLGAFAFYRLHRQFDVGLDASGIAAGRLRAQDSQAYLTESVTGHSVGAMVRYRNGAGSSRVFNYAIGAGVDRYNIDIQSYFDPVNRSYPETQPSRSFNGGWEGAGLQLRGDVQYYFVRDVAITAGAIGRRTGSADVPEIRLEHPNPALTRILPAHTINLSSLQFALGLVMHF